MTTLVTALYAEGPTDQRFLPLIIQRTAYLFCRLGAVETQNALF